MSKLPEIDLGSLKKVKREIESRLLAIPGVAGVGIGQDSVGRLGIKIYVQEDSSPLRDNIVGVTEKLEDEGIEFLIEEVGEVRSL